MYLPTSLNCRYRWSDLRVHSGDEPDEESAFLPADIHAVRGLGHDDGRGAGRGAGVARRGRRVRRVVRGRVRGAVLRAGHADVAAVPRPGRGGPPGRALVRVRIAAGRRRGGRGHAAAAAVPVRRHSHAEPDRLDAAERHAAGRAEREGGRPRVGRVHRAHRVEARVGRTRVLLLPAGVRFLRAALLLGGRAARLPRAHQRHDGRRVPERRPPGRHRSQPGLPGSPQAHADVRLGHGHVRVAVGRRRLPVRVPRRGRPARRPPSARPVPAVRVLRHVRRAPVAVERVRRDVPDGRQGHHERRALLVRLRAHVRRHQGVPAAGGHVRHTARVDRVRGLLFRHGHVRRVRPAGDHRQDLGRDHRRVQVGQVPEQIRQTSSALTA